MPSSVESLQNLNSQAVPKFQVGGLLFGDATATAPAIGSVIAADGTITVPAGYTSAGWIDTDGVTETRSMTSDLTNGWQSLASIRSDVTADALSLKAKFQERNAVSHALEYGITIAAAQAAFAGAGLAMNRDTSGMQPKRRVIEISRDTYLGITRVRVLPNVVYADQGDMTVGRATELKLDATFNILYDTVYGTDCATAMNGPGWTALANVNATPWAATTAYALNQYVTLTTGGGGTVRCTTAGTSGSTQPTLPGSVGGTVTDGTVTWTRVS